MNQSGISPVCLESKGTSLVSVRGICWNKRENMRVDPCRKYLQNYPEEFKLDKERNNKSQTDFEEVKDVIKALLKEGSVSVKVLRVHMFLTKNCTYYSSVINGCNFIPVSNRNQNHMHDHFLVLHPQNEESKIWLNHPLLYSFRHALNNDCMCQSSTC